MDWDKLKIDFTSKFDQLTSLKFSHFSLKDSCRDLFDDLPYLTSEVVNVNEIIEFTYINIRQNSSDIIDNFEGEDTVKTLACQLGFFLALHSFFVSKLSYEFNESTKEELSQWLVDILSCLSVTMESHDWNIFIENFVQSYFDKLSNILTEVFEIMGLELPSKYAAQIPKINTYPSSFWTNDVIEKPKIQKEKIYLKYSDDSQTSMRTDIGDSNSGKMRTMPARRKSRLPTEKSKSSSRSKTKDKPDKSPKLRKSLVKDTPKKRNSVRHVAAMLAAQKKLNGKVLIAPESPIPNKEPSTPTTLRSLKRAHKHTDTMLRRRSKPITETDIMLLEQEEKENSLKRFDSHSRDSSLISLPSKPVTRFKSRLFDLFMSPTKSPGKYLKNAEVNETKTSPFNALTFSQSPSKSISRKRTFFSPTKSSAIAPELMTSPPNKKRRATPTKINFFSPVKSSVSQTLTSIAIESSPRTPLKSCLKSPTAPKLARKTRPSDRSSILLSPKIKQRSFLGSEPPQNFCEDTVFMDTSDFIASSRGRHTNIGQDPFVPDDSSLSSTMSSSNVARKESQPPIVGERPRRVLKRKSKQLFEPIFAQLEKDKENAVFDKTLSNRKNNASDVNPHNILSTSRRSMILQPNFRDLDPETDISNSFI